MVSKILSGFWLSLAVTILGMGYQTAAYADGPDLETTTYVLSRYTLVLEGGRDGCTRYANPKAIYAQNNSRSLPVLLTRGELGGSLCNGVFMFKTLKVNCDRNTVAYIEQIGSPSMWKKPYFYENIELAKKICALPTQN